MVYQIHNTVVTIQLSDFISLLEDKLLVFKAAEISDPEWSYTQQIEDTTNLIAELKAKQ